MWSVCRYRWRNFYPRPPRGGRRLTLPRLFLAVDISIHALREEGDVIVAYTTYSNHISIHALREEGDDVLFSEFFP